MNREIKFRAWDGEEMVMLTNSGLQYYDFEGSYSLGFTVDGYDGFWAHEQCKGATERASKFHIMQYTGLHDKNGKEIYEGDVCAFYNKYNKTDYKRVVRYCPMLACFGLYPDMTEVWNYESDWIKIINIEVIGNIYESPELLNN